MPLASLRSSDGSALLFIRVARTPHEAGLIRPVAWAISRCVSAKRRSGASHWLLPLAVGLASGIYVQAVGAAEGPGRWDGPTAHACKSHPYISLAQPYVSSLSYHFR